MNNKDEMLMALRMDSFLVCCVSKALLSFFLWNTRLYIELTINSKPGLFCTLQLDSVGSAWLKINFNLMFKFPEFHKYDLDLDFVSLDVTST